MGFPLHARLSACHTSYALRIPRRSDGPTPGGSPRGCPASPCPLPASPAVFTGRCERRERRERRPRPGLFGQGLPHPRGVGTGLEQPEAAHARAAQDLAGVRGAPRAPVAVPRECAASSRTWCRWRSGRRPRKTLTRGPGVRDAGAGAPRPAPTRLQAPGPDSGRQPPIADIGRSGWRKAGSSSPDPAFLPHIAAFQRSAISSSGAPERSGAAQVGLLAGEQAVAHLAVGGEPGAVAGPAEGAGDGGDHADPGRPAVDQPALGGRAAAHRLAFGGEREAACAARRGSRRR